MTIQGDVSWLGQMIDDLPHDIEILTPSEWAEENRYLPPSTSPMPGYFRYDVTPYMREIVDCLSVDSPVRHVVLMKGAQIGANVAAMESGLGYFIGHVKTAPCMFVTADAELAKLRMDSYIKPMIAESGLSDCIRSSDVANNRRTGNTDKKLEWVGGGWLVPFGAQSANKMRSLSALALFRDEIDGWPDTVGKDGDPIQLTTARTSAYEDSRKIFDFSTPLIKGTSKIEPLFNAGDQRYYYVCCLKCSYPQVLRWSRTGKDGVVSGIVWETERGNLVPGSVRYLCKECGAEHINEDKTRLLSPEHGAEWRPTAVPSSPWMRSYHVSGLYSPVGMQSWEACVAKWLLAWDVEKNRPRDVGNMQVFYNNILGKTFELRGEKLTFEKVSPHRRPWYRYGEIPNSKLQDVCGGPVYLLACAVDVQKDYLAVAVWGWCRDRRPLLVDYWRFEGDTEQLDDAATWGRLEDLIENKVYVADDGKRYVIRVTLIDSGYRTDTVYRFCERYAGGVYPSKGRSLPPKNANIKEFSSFTTPGGTMAFTVTVDMYKDRWAAALKRDWDGIGLQPDGCFNAPADVTDRQLRELTVETKREVIDQRTKQRIGWEWYRPAGSDNELWDLLVYGNAALDMMCVEYCVTYLEMEALNWVAFYDACESGLFFEG